MVKVTEYWNKVVDDPTAPFGRRVLKDEYEIKSTQTVDNTLAALKKRFKGHPRMTFGVDFIREDNNSNAYGIRSYTIIMEA